MNNNIQEYLYNSNAKISFGKNNQIYVTQEWDDGKGKQEVYQSWDHLIKNLEYDAKYSKIKNEFYLEISGRQTGKTYRMLQDVIRHIEAGGIACIYSPLKYTFFRNVILEQLREMGLSMGQRVTKILYNPKEDDLRGYDKRLIRNYFDEFDFESHKHPMNQKSFFDPNGYYCTSPQKFRNKENLFHYEIRERDLLLKLYWYNNLEANRRINEKFLTEKDFLGMGDEHFKLEIEAKFIR